MAKTELECLCMEPFNYTIHKIKLKKYLIKLWVIILAQEKRGNT